MISDVESRLRRVERALATIDDQLRVLSEEAGAAAQRILSFRPAPTTGTSKSAGASVLISVVRACDDDPLAGVVVQASQGAGAIMSVATNAAGQAAFSFPAAGSTTFTASSAGFNTATITLNLVSGTASSATITLNADSTHVCCSSCPTLLPATVTLSDPFGSVSLVWNASSNAWEACRIVTLVGTNLQNGGAECIGIADVQTPIVYQLECLGAPLNFQLTMSYNACEVAGSPAFLLPASGACANPVAPLGRSETEVAATSTCSPLNLTFNMKTAQIYGANGATLVVTS